MGISKRKLTCRIVRAFLVEEQKIVKKVRPRLLAGCFSLPIRYGKSEKYLRSVSFYLLTMCKADELSAEKDQILILSFPALEP